MLDVGTASSPVSSRGRLDTIMNKLSDNTEIVSATSENNEQVSTKAANTNNNVDEAVKIIKKSKRLAVFENISSA